MFLIRLLLLLYIIMCWLWYLNSVDLSYCYSLVEWKLQMCMFTSLQSVFNMLDLLRSEGLKGMICRSFLRFWDEYSIVNKFITASSFKGSKPRSKQNICPYYKKIWTVSGRLLPLPALCLGRRGNVY